VSNDKISNQILSEISNKLDVLQAQLQQVAKWLRFENLPKLRRILLKELDDDTKKLVFEFTDGEKSRRDIAGTLSIPDSKV
jgi:hypothetical protein